MDTKAKIMALRSQGVPEVDAIKQAYDDGEDYQDEGVLDETALTDEPLDDEVEMAEDSRSWVIVTKDFTGLGWANTLDLEGEEVTVAVDYSLEDNPDQRERMERVGEDWLEVDDVKRLAKTHKDSIWIFAENYHEDIAKQLMSEGVEVFPASIELSEEMEHEREVGTEIAEDSGLEPPPTHEFASREDALTILEENPDTAFVMKLNDNKFNYQTLVPVRKKDSDANREVYNYLANMDEECGDGILQERIPLEDSLEINCELWYYQGQAFMATLGLEVKRKDTYDVGEMCGCAGDFMKVIPMDSKLVAATIGKMDKFYVNENYTGFADVNIIFTPDNEPHFLEVCNRFGYNAHPNIMLALCKDNFGDVMYDYIHGNVEGMVDRFYPDFGCSLTLFCDHPRPGLPVHVDSRVSKRFYPFDGYKREGQLLLTGYSDEVGIYVDRGVTIGAAWDKVSTAIAQDEVVSFPDIKYRWDLASDNYYNAPILRYKELLKRGLL